MKKITVILICLFFLEACSNVREGFTLKKKSPIDEFLVEKKNPLVLPPDFGKLPVPHDEVKSSNKKDEEVKDLISKKNENSTSKVKKTKPTSIEKSILEKIQ